MTIPENPNRLHAQLATMINLEIAIEAKLNQLIPLVSEHVGTSTLLTEFLSMTGEHRLALEERLNSIADPKFPIAKYGTNFPTGSPTGPSYNIASTALQIVYTMFHQALIGYSVLEAHGTRFRDSPYLEDAGTSFHLAVQFTNNYAQAIQQITRTLHDVLLWELDRDGFECQCLCPACGLGICLCSIAGRFYINNAWEEAGPFYEAAPIYVQRPKQNSPAAHAGLQRGYVITAVEGQELESWTDLQGVLRNADPGEEVRFEIHHQSGDVDKIAILIPNK